MKKNNKFLVIHCAEMKASKYEGNKFIAQVQVTVDEDSTAEDVKAALEDYRKS